ncbi:Helicase associated domain protein [Puia dinghuensis]|uniref:Helicase C-terminal domain-containing protein n=1 Tax=Puia dinghuensis TaxID=1792502 RepID=A0A8J2XTD4_9BACT|nr:Helicase associated domain protein [Puia dinghuensis]GGB03056.1 hypothetical protein GCM10011511_27950 [Puia dinghuensis]
MQLYPHNQRAYDSAVNALEHHNKTCIIHPTGTGKAVIIAKFIISNPTARHLLLAPGEHICAEVQKHVDGANFFFCTYRNLLTSKTLSGRNNFDFIYLDEFHRVGARGWGPKVLQLLDRNPQAKVLGTTATHIRFLDHSRDMAFELFRNNIASYFSLHGAFLEGILMAPKYISAIYSISQEYRRMEEKIGQTQHQQKESLIREMKARVIDWEKSSGLDAILKKHLPPSRKKIIVFCTTLKEMKMAEETLTPMLKSIFGRFLSLPLHTKFGKKVNARHLSRFDKDDNLTKVLFTVNMITEGLHSKDISTVILLRETSSPIIWYQQIGRCFSVDQKEQPIILDLVNNFRNLQHARFKADHEEEKAASDDSKIMRPYNRLDKVPTAIEFIDETQGIQDILTSFENRIDNWAIGYSRAKAFFEKKGHLKVPMKEDLNLLRWIEKQQSAFRAGRLSSEKVSQLTQIGIDWNNTSEERWYANYRQLRKIIEEQGYLPRTRIDKPLARWFARQKRLYQQNKLEKEYRHLLEEIISLENDREVLWTKRLDRLEEYFARHNKFPQGRGSEIQTDVRQVRVSHRMGSLPQFVYDRLIELGFKFKYERNTYEQTLELLIKFIRENNGNLPTENTNYYLRQWFSTQCSKYRHGRLKKEHIDLFRMQETATSLKLLPTLIITQNSQARRA